MLYLYIFNYIFGNNMMKVIIKNLVIVVSFCFSVGVVSVVIVGDI